MLLHSLLDDTLCGSNVNFVRDSVLDLMDDAFASTCVNVVTSTALPVPAIAWFVLVLLRYNASF